MVTRQTKNAKNILYLLEDNIDHLKSKWKVYYDQGFLFKTSSFELTTEYINNLVKKIEEMDNTIGYIFSEKYVQTIENNIKELQDDPIINSKYENLGHISNDEMNHEYDDDKHKYQREILFGNPKNIDDEFYQKLLTIDDKNWINLFKIGNIINNTYLEIENISDLINALDLNFSKRLVGIDTTEIGTELDTRSFGNIQMIYNSAETLMFDYATSIKSVEKYDGQIVFGFRNRAISYPIFKVVVIPSYAEFYLEYLSILAHEAFHIVEKSRLIESVHEEIIQMKEKINDIVEPFAHNWNDQDIYYNVSEATVEKLTGDVLADIYAICVGGDAYYSTMEKFYVPLLYDLNVHERSNVPTPDYLHSSFSISSLRSRICNLTYSNIYGNHEKTNLCNDKIENWEILSSNINRYYILKNGGNEELLSEINTMNQEIRNVGRKIEKSNIVHKMQNLIDYKHTDKEYIDLINQNIYGIHEEGTVINLLSGSPTIVQLKKMWVENEWLKPRHILSMFAENKKYINRNAVLFLLANHDNIKRRYNK